MNATIPSPTVGAMGHIVSWSAPASVPLGTLRDALTSAGFDRALAANMLPRNAFRRACAKLTEKRIIRQVRESDTEIDFQFTIERLNGSEFEYSREAVLTLDKANGVVTCAENPHLAGAAETKLYEEIAVRRTGDITRLIQRIYDGRRGDLVPLRRQGGVYFVPIEHEVLVKQTADLLAAIGGTMNQFKIHFGDPDTSKSVAEELNSHLLDLVEQFRASLDSVSRESNAGVAERRQRTLQDLRGKLIGYQGLLEGYAAQIEAEIDGAEAAMLKKLLDGPALPQEQQPMLEPVEAFAGVLG